MSDDPRQSIEQTAATDLTTTARIAVRRELASLAGELQPGEAPVTVSRGALAGRFGLIAVTDQRLIFLDKAKLDSKTRSVPMSEIGWLTSGTTPLGYGMLRVGVRHADGKVLKFKVIPKERAAEIEAAIEPFIDADEAPVGADDFADEVAEADAPASTPAAPVSETPSQLIAKLSELRDAGVISSDEFEAKQSEILSKVMED